MPAPSRLTVTSWHRATGGASSATVIVAVQVEVFPLASVTVKVTTLSPRVVQSKMSGVRLISVTAQLSDDPLSTAAGVTTKGAVTVISWQTATGAIVSNTVTLK